MQFPYTVSYLFHTYFVVTNLKNIYPITFRKYTKQPIKVLFKKFNLFYKEDVNMRLLSAQSKYFCTECTYLIRARAKTRNRGHFFPSSLNRKFRFWTWNNISEISGFSICHFFIFFLNRYSKLGKSVRIFV